MEISIELGHKPGIAYNLNSLGCIAYIKGDIELSSNLFESSIELNKELNQRKELVVNILGFAETAFARDDSKKATVLIGFFKEYFDSMKMILDRTDSKRYEALTQKMKEKLSGEEFSKHYEEGNKMVIEEAVELALSQTSNVKRRTY